MTNIQTVILTTALVGGVAALAFVDRAAYMVKSPVSEPIVFGYSFTTVLRVDNNDECLLREDPTVVLIYKRDQGEYIPYLNNTPLPKRLWGDVLLIPGFNDTTEMCGVAVDKRRIE